MKIQIPTECPCCGSKPLELVNDQLFCRNSACSAQLNKKLEHFCKVLGIKGAGPKTLEKLDLSDITELFYLDVATVADALGSERMATKLLEEVEKSKSAGLAKVLASLSIPLIGETASEKIAQVVTSVDEINPETCKLAGLGDKATSNLVEFLKTEFKAIREFLPFSMKSSPKTTVVADNSKNKTVCITGKLTSFKTKSLAHTALTAAGYTPVETVTKSLDYLVDEGDKGSSKRQKAEQLGVQIITNLDSFLKETQ